jgi:group II intron reverse transcriptase/maturase
VERAQREPEGRFHALRISDRCARPRRAYRRQRANAAVGVDGVTKEHYGQTWEANLQELHARLKAQRYRHQPIHVFTSPKPRGKTRPIGHSAFEDKVVQDAVREVLEAIYEQDFLGCSYGFRPGRSAHDAVRTLEQIVHRGEVRWIFEADIVSFFDSLDRTELKKMLEVRVADGSLLRLIGKCLHVGVLDGEAVVEPELGTVQGSVLSPLLGNIYLHYVLDRWFATEVKPRLRGKTTLIRYCDDFIIGFEREEDARRVRVVARQAAGRFDWPCTRTRTRLLPFLASATGQQSGKGPATFDFLGFTFYWTRTRTGLLADGVQDSAGEPETAKQALYDWCRRHRHQPLRPSTPRSVDVGEATSTTSA